MTDYQTSSFESPLKVDKDWKEKFFYPANHVKSVKGCGSNTSKNVSEVEPKKVRKNYDAPIKKGLVAHKMRNNRGCPNQQRKRIVSVNNYNKKDNDYYSKTTHPSTHKHMAPRAVLMKIGLKSFNTARPVNTIRSVNTGRPFSTA
ncbi:hypothetical protein Tco_0645688, partial [Tanacetum coccineum]